MAFRGSKSGSEPSQSTGYTQGLEFQWINEQERQRNPASQSSIIRSTARKNQLLKQKILNSNNTSSTQFRRLEIMPEPIAVVAPREDSHAAAHSGDPSNDSVKGSAMVSMLSREENIQAQLETCESTVFKLIESVHSSGQPSIPEITNDDRRSRLTYKRSQNNIYEIQAHGHYKSQPQKNLTRQSPRTGGQYLGQHRASPKMVLGQGFNDPFDSFPIKMQTHTHNLIAYCRDIFHCRPLSPHQLNP